MASAYSPVTRSYPSVPQLALPSSLFSSQQHLKCSNGFSLRVRKDRSRVRKDRSRVRKDRSRVRSMRQESEVSETKSHSWNPSILKSETPVLVEFYTNWCEPCHMVHQVVDEIATYYAGKLKCVAINVEQEPRVAEEYDIKAVPIVLLFKNGEKCESVVGTVSKEFFVGAIERVLAS